MNVPLDLQNKLTDMNLQLDKIKEQMEKEGVAPALVLFHDTVNRAAFSALVTCQHQRTPIEDIDEAVVASISSILFDYMQRVHRIGDKRDVIQHMKLIFDDVKERLAIHVAGTFHNASPPPPPSNLKVVKH